MLQENGNIYRIAGQRYDAIEVGYLSKSTDDISTTEPVVKVITEGGYCWGAMPIIDVIKYAMREHPELIEQAQQEINTDAALATLGSDT